MNPFLSHQVDAIAEQRNRAGHLATNTHLLRPHFKDEQVVTNRLQTRPAFWRLKQVCTFFLPRYGGKVSAPLSLYNTHSERCLLLRCVQFTYLLSFPGVVQTIASFGPAVSSADTQSCPSEEWRGVCFSVLACKLIAKSQCNFYEIAFECKINNE